MKTKLKLDRVALGEDARKIGVGMLIGGLVGTVLRDVPTVPSVILSALGIGLILLGAIRYKESQ